MSVFRISEFQHVRHLRPSLLPIGLLDGCDAKRVSFAMQNHCNRLVRLWFTHDLLNCSLLNGPWLTGFPVHNESWIIVHKLHGWLHTTSKSNMLWLSMLDKPGYPTWIEEMRRISVILHFSKNWLWNNLRANEQRLLFGKERVQAQFCLGTWLLICTVCS